MKPASIYLAFLLICLVVPDVLRAQYNYNHSYIAPDNELYVSEGIVTLEQIRGWAGPAGMSGFVSMPSAMTGAAFITYRRSITHKLSLGFTAGLDNESGDLSYGNPEQNATGLEGTTGHYIVRSYTLATEALFAYIKKGRFMFYGYGGAGATIFKDNYTLYYGNGTPVTLPSNPYTYSHTYFNMQVSPIGIRFGGNIAGFVEMGFGYKGLISGGLSARF